MAKFLSGFAWLMIAVSLPMPSGALAQSGEPAKTAIGAAAKTAISAATAFAIGYGVWRIEQKCRKMPAEKHDEYGRIIADGMLRLREAVDERLFNAALTGGETTAIDPKIANCDDASLFDFGMRQATEALEKLVSLPGGYHLKMTD